MLRGLGLRQPGMGQHPDAARQIALNRHLLAVQQGHSIPAWPLPGFRGWEAGVEISGHGKGQRHNPVRGEGVAGHQRIDQLAVAAIISRPPSDLDELQAVIERPRRGVVDGHFEAQLLDTLGGQRIEHIEQEPRRHPAPQRHLCRRRGSGDGCASCRRRARRARVSGGGRAVALPRAGGGPPGAAPAGVRRDRGAAEKPDVLRAGAGEEGVRGKNAGSTKQ